MSVRVWNETYSTTDIKLAAYLLTFERRFIKAEKRPDGVYEFQFEEDNSGELKRLVDEWQMGWQSANIIKKNWQSFYFLKSRIDKK